LNLRWDGRNEEVLLAQNYSPEDKIAHFRALKQYFDDPRYVRLGGGKSFGTMQSMGAPFF